MAQDQRVAPAGRQVLKLFVENSSQLAQDGAGRGVNTHGRGLQKLIEVSAVAFPLLAACPACFQLQGQAIGDPVQPASDRTLLADAGVLGSQDREGGLESIILVRAGAKDPAANGEHKFAMPVHQGGKSSLIGERCEALEELLVAKLVDSQRAHVVEDVSEGKIGHGMMLQGRPLPH